MLVDDAEVKILFSSEVAAVFLGLDSYDEARKVSDYAQISSNNTRLRRPSGKIQMCPQIERCDISIRDDLPIQYTVRSSKLRCQYSLSAKAPKMSTMEEEDQRHEVCPIERVPGLYLTEYIPHQVGRSCA